MTLQTILLVTSAEVQLHKVCRFFVVTAACPGRQFQILDKGLDSGPHRIGLIPRENMIDWVSSRYATFNKEQQVDTANTPP